MSAIVIPFPAARAAGEIARRAERRTALELALARCLDAAEGIVAELDRLDGDPDFEPDADAEDDGNAEPSLGAPAGGDSQVPWAAGGSSDAEQEAPRSRRRPGHLPPPVRLGDTDAALLAGCSRTVAFLGHLCLLPR